jgi:two-component system, OmpR family, response regulator
MKLLLIEDDAVMVASLRRGLHEAYLVDAVATGVEGLHEAEVGDYDGIVLDLMLPDMLGVTVCQRLRQRQIATPILILTGRDSIRDKVLVLDAGADDYLTKPFSLEELRVRLRVLVRREPQWVRTSRLTVGDLELDMATRRTSCRGVPIQLRRKEYALLEYLMHHAGSVVTRAMIIDHVWDVGDSLWTNAVDVHIKYLRDKIDRPFDMELIKTVHGVGYMMEVPVESPVAAPAREGGR